MFIHHTIYPQIVLRRHRIISILIISLAIHSSLPAQTFVEVSTPFPQHIGGAGAWGDYDNDGDLDIVITGGTSSEPSGFFAKIYRNDAGSFVDIQAPLVPLAESSAAWGDHDNDGDLDLLLTGSKEMSATFATIYRNDDGHFVDTHASFRSLNRGSAAWADFDNDGDPDILVVGESWPDGVFSKIVRNDGHDTFNEIEVGFPGIFFGMATWVDYDSDMDLDVLLAGETLAGESLSQLHRNDEGVFQQDVEAMLPGLSDSFAAWSDYDGDGDADLFLGGGELGGSGFSRLWKNDGGRLVPTQINFPHSLSGSAAWGDYDGDNRPDLLLTGRGLFQNTGSGFQDVVAGIIGSSRDPALWGDYDADGRLDVYVDGRLFHNELPTSNLAPPAPFNLQAATNEKEVLLSWDYLPGADTTETTVSFNLRLGTQPGLGDIVSPMADAVTGFHRIPQIGNAGYLKQQRIKNLAAGTYYWSVQAVDAGFAGSPFAEDNSFTITLTAPNQAPLVLNPIVDRALMLGRDTLALNLIANPIVFSDPDGDQLYFSASSGDASVVVASVAGVMITLVPAGTGRTTITVTADDDRGGSVQTSFYVRVISLPEGAVFTEVPVSLPPTLGGSVAWGDYDNDGDLDILLSGEDDFGNKITEIFRNDSGSFTAVQSGLPKVSSGDAVWTDYDNDGDLDIALSGWSLNGRLTRLYRNQAGQFLDTGVSLITTHASSMAWGDYDNDGDLDLLITGVVDGGDTGTRLLRNDNGTFVDTRAALASLHDGSAVWGDYDNDGDLDMLLTGEMFGQGRQTRIYRNDASSFVDIAANLAGVNESSAAFGDYDNDGDLDILLSGQTGTGELSRIYRNDAGTFVDVRAPIAQVGRGGVAWGDFDNDGDLDLMMTGYNMRDTAYVAHLYQNHENSFIDIGSPFEGGDLSAIAWGDYDNDNDLDLLIIGINYNHGAATKLYRNDMGVANTAPSAPVHLSSTVSGDSLILIWDPANDAQTHSRGLTYNLRAGTTPGGAEIVSPMADLRTGYRLQPQLGNVNHNKRWIIRNLAGKTVYWSVQAIDNAFAGSAFATEQKVVTSVQQPDENVPLSFALAPNYPNPFHAATTIAYSIPATHNGRRVVIEIYNTLGQRIRTLVDARLQAGNYQTPWLAQDDAGHALPSGLYFVRLRAGAFVATRKMLYLQRR